MIHGGKNYGLAATEAASGGRSKGRAKRMDERITGLTRREFLKDTAAVSAGMAEDVEEDGALRVRVEDGTVTRIYAGDVRLLRS